MKYCTHVKWSIKYGIKVSELYQSWSNTLLMQTFVIFLTVPLCFVGEKKVCFLISFNIGKTVCKHIDDLYHVVLCHFY